MTIARLIAGQSGEVWTIHADDTVAQAVEVLATRRIGALPVRDTTEDVVGIFSERDVLYSLRRHGGDVLALKVHEVMTSPVVTVSPDTSVMEALALMTRRRFRHLPVVDGGRMVSFISIGDLVKYRIDRIEAEAEAMRAYIQTA
ncbi:CBS domain-containing protein [Novosphingobium sp. FKTRR1]|uniref:CBS domain-containing protein n=1 Tax=unclassified Novosphingobium TaxID=2644732 RepID=UPI001CF09B70|nr:CBS domain-containing protein [Novosphingobium sp. FKTRR1]